MSEQLEYALLGYLRQRPSHGYDLRRRLADPAGLGIVWRLKQSQLYALLSRLEGEGVVMSTYELQATRPPRKVFRLTDRGERAFLEWVKTPVAHGRQLRLEFLAKLYFAQREGPQISDRLIERQMEACRSWLSDAQGSATMAADRLYAYLVHAFRAGQIQAMLEWLELCKDLTIENEA
jgi:DNA-binding PadR family transcriptional regulator